MRDRMILHCDCNGFYASVECVRRPELRDVPMAVCGDPESRHGIILAKNELAKSFGVQTAETVWQAQRKCPQLVMVPPHHDLYRKYSQRINAIYQQYTDCVEPFGIDESFLDVTGSIHLFGGNAVQLADELRRRVKEETGLTISVGVSFCKIFAKLGSDMKKPDATTVIDRDSYQHIVWPLQVGALLYVGKATRESLERIFIHTIGDLARADREVLFTRLGKMGELLHDYANGIDDSPVRTISDPREIQSVGNGATFRRNLVGLEDIRTGVAALADTVAHRLRCYGLCCETVQVIIKDAEFHTISRQKALEQPSCLSREIARAAVELVRSSWNLQVPIRLLTITGLKLVPADASIEQLSLFADVHKQQEREKLRKLETALDSIRDKYGGSSITSGALLCNDLGVGISTQEEEGPALTSSDIPK